jgi:hypothetical protein
VIDSDLNRCILLILLMHMHMQAPPHPYSYRIEIPWHLQTTHKTPRLHPAHCTCLSSHGPSLIPLLPLGLNNLEPRLRLLLPRYNLDHIRRRRDFTNTPNPCTSHFRTWSTCICFASSEKLLCESSSIQSRRVGVD